MVHKVLHQALEYLVLTAGVIRLRSLAGLSFASTFPFATTLPLGTAPLLWACTTGRLASGRAPGTWSLELAVLCTGAFAIVLSLFSAFSF